MLTALVFAAAFAALAGLALWRYPICAVYLYILVFYVHPPSRWWGAYLPDLRWSMLSAVIAVLTLVVHWRRLQPAPRPWSTSMPGLMLLVFLLWFWVQNLWALDAETHLSASVQFVKYMIACYLIYRLADTPQKLTDTLLAHVAGCAYLGLLCLERGRDLGDRLNGVGGPGIDDANSLGMVLATAVVVAFVGLLTQVGWRRIACVLALPLILNGLILTGSRGAFLGMLAGIFTVYLLRPPKRQWVFVGMGVMAIALGAYLVDDKFVDRMFTMKSAVGDPSTMDSSSESRVVLIEAQLKMFAEYPMGSGHRGTATLSPKYLDEQWLTGREGEQAERSSHNTFMTLLTEQGIPGVILYAWSLLWGAVVLIHLRRARVRGAPPELMAPAAACFAGLAVVLVAGNFTDYLLAEVQYWFLCLLAGALWRLNAERSKAPAAASLPVQAASRLRAR